MNIWLQSLRDYSHTALDAFAGLAMRLYTDASRWWLAQTVDIEIGGALTDDTPPEFAAEASWPQIPGNRDLTGINHWARLSFHWEGGLLTFPKFGESSWTKLRWPPPRLSLPWCPLERPLNVVREMIVKRIFRSREAWFKLSSSLMIGSCLVACGRRLPTVILKLVGLLIWCMDVGSTRMRMKWLKLIIAIFRYLLTSFMALVLIGTFIHWLDNFSALNRRGWFVWMNIYLYWFALILCAPLPR